MAGPARTGAARQPAAGDSPSEFVEQMYLAVVEEHWLWEVPLGLSDGRGGYEHGPWNPAECSRQLVAWFDAGLLELYTDPPDDAPRPQNVAEWRAWHKGRYRVEDDPGIARAVLADPSRWTGSPGDGFLRLAPTDAGMAPDAAWV
ncbi:hypothetical protein [Blastococcus saxobsidens]|uniref:Uncharacterized protein n=1 Tax=Blastococcus saxobsidens TaxID=138336 RepID=A0A4Q7YAS6_9ACTN|nr:hypothetical protein [Blastococcus saxobsidens]RZU33928.1 hypothetical protein BKA19_3669 [Blastococcus saxobsidens]